AHASARPTGPRRPERNGGSRHSRPQSLRWMKRSCSSETDESVERIGARAADQDVECGDGPHQRIFQAELIPKIAADAPPLDITDQKESKAHRGGWAREQAERQ